MPLSVEAIARVCHEANRALQFETGDPAPSLAFDDAPAWQRESAVEGVRAALAGTSAAEQHEAWCDHKRADGWTYGPVKDAEAKTHPCLVDYDELPAEQQAKDELFVSIVGALGEVAPSPLDLDNRHPSVAAILRYFESGHLPPHLAAVSAACRTLAVLLADTLPSNPELTVALRKLLEAKDAAVRAAL